MDYKQAVDYIHSTLKFGSKLGLQNMRKLLALMGDPHKKLKFIHIAGTNGKGSVVSYLSHILIENGLRVGTYTSPYIMVFNERIKLDFENIEDGELGLITTYVKEKIDMLLAKGENHPTEFEIITCIAFEYFMRKKCDIVVLETGLGGRLDATNIIEAPEYAVITKIGMDHMEYLGTTLGQIAAEKAGIIKRGSKIFSVPQEEEAMLVLKKACDIMDCPLYVIDPGFELLSRDIMKQCYKYDGNEICIKLHGDHQIENSILAYELSKDMGISTDTILRGLLKTVWVGRFEVLRRSPTVIIDGAHNIQGVIELGKTIRSYFKDKKIIFIMGVFKDKDYAGMIRQVYPLAKYFHTIDIDNPRALDAEELMEEIKKYFSGVEKSSGIKEALEKSIGMAEKDDIIIAFGSLSYIGEVKRLIESPGG